MASVDKRASGKWLARWREYPGGPQKSKTFDRKIDAERHLVQVQSDLARGSYIAPADAKTTFSDFYRLWAARQPWRSSSRASIESVFENHVLPTFGARPLGSVRRGDVESWAAGLTLAARTSNQAVRYIATLYDAAIADGLAASNPARLAKRPRIEASQVVPFTTVELERLREAAPPWFRVALVLGATVGLRQGEAAGLTVDRVDFLRRTVKVDRQLRVDGGGWQPPKTDRSHRLVPLADVAVEGIAAHLSAHGEGRDGLVLHDGGRPVGRGRFGDVWRSLRVRAGKPPADCVRCDGGGVDDGQVCSCVWAGAASARFHDTRHTFASVLLSGGVSVAAAAEYLGHSPAVLLRTYAHLIPADHDRARSVVQAAFSMASADPAEDPVRTEAGG